VPNGPGDIATFATSNLPSVTVQSNIEVGQIMFAAGASAFTITISPQETLTLSGVGVTNESGQQQNFDLEAIVQANFTQVGVINLENTATSGTNTVYSCAGAMTQFNFGAFVRFLNSSSAGGSTFVLNGGAASEAYGGLLIFYDTSTAADATITAQGGTVEDSLGASVAIGTSGTPATAGNATIIANGGTAAGAAGAKVSFDVVRASEPTLIANGGVNGGDGGGFFFNDQIANNLAHVEVYGNGLLDISNSFNTTIGSLAGDGMVDLGDFTLTVGGNNQNTSFAGLIEQVNTEGGKGVIKKVGTGTLRLSHDNTFKGGITISDGTVVIQNRTGSGSGSGNVTVQGGILAGKGIIKGLTTIGTGSGPGSILQPSKAASTAATLTIQSSLFIKSDGTYTWKLNTNKATADQVIAKGVSIASSAQFIFKAVANKKLTVGTVFTAISNTATTTIAGTFANLANGSIVTVGANNFQANYEGGDGNDLTLTAVQ